MEQYVKRFVVYLQQEKHASVNTISSYQRDLLKLCGYLEQHGIKEWKLVTETNLNSYILTLEAAAFSTATISRSIAVMKTFYLYLMRAHMVQEDVAYRLKSPKVEHKKPVELTEEDMQQLLASIEKDNARGMRDYAMLLLLYATGIRVSELVRLTVEDVCLEHTYLLIDNGKKQRVVPFDEKTKMVLSEYLQEARIKLQKEMEQTLFLNAQGHAMTRQGVWKILKGYAKKASISKEITPYTIRYSCETHKNKL